MHGTAHDHVVDFGGIDAGTLDRFSYGGRAEAGATQIVKSAAIGFADGSACGRYDIS